MDLYKIFIALCGLIVVLLFFGSILNVIVETMVAVAILFLFFFIIYAWNQT
jgi:hypothetical protein